MLRVTKADIAEISKAERKLEARKLAADFSLFFREAWKVLNDKVPLTESWHYDYLCEWLTYAASGQMKKDHPTWRGIIINVPPRTLKSAMVNILFPDWVWASHPEKKFLCVSYGAELAINELATKRRKLLGTDWYTERWSKVRIQEDVNLKHRWDSNEGGYMIATTPGGHAAGSGANIIVIDDIIKMADESVYGADRENANGWYETEGYSRLNDQSKDFFIVVCQRLHEMDFPGYLNKNESGLWHNIVIPLECEEDTDYVFPISGKVYHRKKGEVLLPDRFPPHVVEQLKRHPVRWAGQYQQKPMPDTGNLMDPNWWMEYETDPSGKPDPEHPLPGFDQVLVSVDASMKGTQSSDFSCLQKHGFNREKDYVLDCVNERMDAVRLESAIIDMVCDTKCPKELRPTVLLIEETANGAAVIQRLRKLPNPLPVTIVAVNPEGGKKSRAMACQPEVAQGNCYLPKNAPWKRDFLQQLALGVDVAEYDDMIDSFSQAWAYRREHRWGFFESLETAKAVTSRPTVEKKLPVAPTAQERKKSNSEGMKDTMRAEFGRRMGRGRF